MCNYTNFHIFLKKIRVTDLVRENEALKANVRDDWLTLRRREEEDANIALARYDSLVPYVFFAASLFNLVSYFSLVYDASGTYKPEWSEWLG